MICKKHLNGVGYSIVEGDEAKQIFAAALPCSGNSFAEQAESALDALNSALRQESAEGKVVLQTVFLQDNGEQEHCRKIMRRFYRDALPPTSYIAQPPCGGNRLAIEAWAIADPKNSVQVARLGEKIALVRSKKKTVAYFADIRPIIDDNEIYDRSLSAFQSADMHLRQAGMTFDDVLRTWLYLGEITAPEKQTTRYLELNRARTNFYQGRKFSDRLIPRPWVRPVFPASTGIGTQGRELVLGGIAIQAKSAGTVVLPMENPDQTAACDYAHQYGKDSPKFARAVSLISGESATIFISGTASITASDTRHA
jgi:enamine deaminase RidA (YjgF/YER057c/UK114 family)